MKKTREKTNYVSNACTFCKKRHFKCSGEPTGCHNCQTRSLECVYPEPKEKRGPKPRPKVQDDAHYPNATKKKKVESTQTKPGGRSFGADGFPPEANGGFSTSHKLPLPMKFNENGPDMGWDRRLQQGNHLPNGMPVSVPPNKPFFGSFPYNNTHHNQTSGLFNPNIFSPGLNNNHHNNNLNHFGHHHPSAQDHSLSEQQPLNLALLGQVTSNQRDSPNFDFVKQEPNTPPSSHRSNSNEPNKPIPMPMGKDHPLLFPHSKSDPLSQFRSENPSQFRSENPSQQKPFPCPKPTDLPSFPQNQFKHDPLQNQFKNDPLQSQYKHDPFQNQFKGDPFQNHYKYEPQQFRNSPPFQNPLRYEENLVSNSKKEGYTIGLQQTKPVEAIPHTNRTKFDHLISAEELQTFMRNWFQNPHYFSPYVFPPDDWEKRIKNLQLSCSVETPDTLWQKKPFNLFDQETQQEEMQKETQWAHNLGRDGQIFAFLALGARNIGKRESAEFLIQCAMVSAKQAFDVVSFETTKLYYLISYYLLFEIGLYKDTVWVSLATNSAKILLDEITEPRDRQILIHIKQTCELRRIALTSSIPQRLKILLRLKESETLPEDLIYARYLFSSSILFHEFKTGQPSFSLLDIQEEQQMALDLLPNTTPQEQERKLIWESFVYGLGSYVFYRSRLTSIAVDWAMRELNCARLISQKRQIEPGTYFSVMLAIRTLYENNGSVTSECSELLQMLNPCFANYPVFKMISNILNVEHILNRVPKSSNNPSSTDFQTTTDDFLLGVEIK